MIPGGKQVVAETENKSSGIVLKFELKILLVQKFCRGDLPQKLICCKKFAFAPLLVYFSDALPPGNPTLGVYNLFINWKHTISEAHVFMDYFPP